MSSEEGGGKSMRVWLAPRDFCALAATRSGRREAAQRLGDALRLDAASPAVEYGLAELQRFVRERFEGCLRQQTPEELDAHALYEVPSDVYRVLRALGFCSFEDEQGRRRALHDGDGVPVCAWWNPGDWGTHVKEGYHRARAGAHDSGASASALGAGAGYWAADLGHGVNEVRDTFARGRLRQQLRRERPTASEEDVEAEVEKRLKEQREQRGRVWGEAGGARATDRSERLGDKAAVARAAADDAAAQRGCYEECRRRPRAHEDLRGAERQVQKLQQELHEASGKGHAAQQAAAAARARNDAAERQVSALQEQLRELQQRSQAAAAAHTAAERQVSALRQQVHELQQAAATAHARNGAAERHVSALQQQVHGLQLELQGKSAQGHGGDAPRRGAASASVGQRGRDAGARPPARSPSGSSRPRSPSFYHSLPRSSSPAAPRGTAAPSTSQPNGRAPSAKRRASSSQVGQRAA